jgi:hypothetical protein
MESLSELKARAMREQRAHLSEATQPAVNQPLRRGSADGSRSVLSTCIAYSCCPSRTSGTNRTSVTGLPHAGVLRLTTTETCDRREMDLYVVC